jgi:hypothetical protein
MGAVLPSLLQPIFERAWTEKKMGAGFRTFPAFLRTGL